MLRSRRIAERAHHAIENCLPSQTDSVPVERNANRFGRENARLTGEVFVRCLPPNLVTSESCPRST